MMDKKMPGILVTGASGFVGRHFLEAASAHYRLFCIARRSQFEAGIPRSANLRWTQVDIGHRNALLDVSRCVMSNGGAEYVLHLAGYYDFTYDDHPEYKRTNVEGTRNVLALADAVGARHFIYASSLAACKFPQDGSSITEDTPPDAAFPYARSKHDAEALIRDYHASFTRSIVRFAAIYAYHRFRQRFKVGQVCETLSAFSRQIRAALDMERKSGLSLTPEEIHDNFDLIIQLACDEVEDVFEQLHERDGEESFAAESMDLPSNSAEMQRMIDELNDICRDGWGNKALFGKAQAGN
jgi:nucleoside-diphosphate-sugar epimerase